LHRKLGVLVSLECLEENRPFSGQQHQAQFGINPALFKVKGQVEGQLGTGISFKAKNDLLGVGASSSCNAFAIATFSSCDLF